MIHCSTGLKVAVTAQRVIILDTQPIMSTSIALEGGMEKAGYSDLQLAVFLLSVCDTVLVVQDWVMDIDVLKFAQAADMLAGIKPLQTIEGGEASLASLTFVFNKLSNEAMEPQNVSEAGTFLRDFFHHDSPHGGRHQNSFFLPFSDASDSAAPLHTSFSSVIRQLREHVASLPSCSNGLSEQEWVKHANETWQRIIHPASAVSDFCRRTLETAAG